MGEGLVRLAGSPPPGTGQRRRQAEGSPAWAAALAGAKRTSIDVNQSCEGGRPALCAERRAPALASRTLPRWRARSPLATPVRPLNTV